MKKRILIVDDDSDFVYITKRSLKTTGEDLEVDHCQNGQEALSYFEKIITKKNIPSPDLVFLDINMPVMNGFEFLEAFKDLAQTKGKLPPPPIVMMVTSSNLDSDRAHTAKYDFVKAFLNKPLRSKDFLALLKDI